MKIRSMLLIALAAYMAKGSYSGGNVADGLAQANRIEIQTITVAEESIELDAAYCFQVWNGSKPDYPPCEDEKLTNLRDYLQKNGDVSRLSHFDWIVDFVIRFDHDVAEGDVTLYGQLAPLFPEWVNFNEISSVPSLKANEDFRLLNVDFITYGLALEMLEGFNCGVKSRRYGTTITVDLKLYDPTGEKEPLSIASCRHTFEPHHKGNWFDAQVENYQTWPEDAFLSFGGSWQSSSSLDRIASVDCAGEMSINADAMLKYVANESRNIGIRPGETVVETTVELGEFSATNLPPVMSDYKGGVLLAEKDGVYWYYGLAKVGEKNNWVRLDGLGVEKRPETVSLRMVFRKAGDDVLVRYVIDGREYTYEGRSEIPVVAAERVNAVGYVGDGTVYSLFASAAQPRSGFVLFMQ